VNQQATFAAFTNFGVFSLDLSIVSFVMHARVWTCSATMCSGDTAMSTLGQNTDRGRRSTATMAGTLHTVVRVMFSCSAENTVTRNAHVVRQESQHGDQDEGGVEPRCIVFWFPGLDRPPRFLLMLLFAPLVLVDDRSQRPLYNHTRTWVNRLVTYLWRGVTLTVCLEGTVLSVLSCLPLFMFAHML